MELDPLDRRFKSSYILGTLQDKEERSLVSQKAAEGSQSHQHVRWVIIFLRYKSERNSGKKKVIFVAGFLLRATDIDRQPLLQPPS